MRKKSIRFYKDKTRPRFLTDPKVSKPLYMANRREQTAKWRTKKIVWMLSPVSDVKVVLVLCDMFSEDGSLPYYSNLNSVIYGELVVLCEPLNL